MGEPERELRDPVFTVRVAAPGQVVHGIVVRAANEEEAKARVEARGHVVVGVRVYGAGADDSLGSSPIKCVLCGYDLTRLPAGKARNVQCPECGSVNLPIGEKSEKAEHRLARVRMRSRVLLLFITLLIVGGITAGLVRQARIGRWLVGGAGTGSATAPTSAPTGTGGP